MSDALDKLKAEVPKLREIINSTAPDEKKDWAKGELKRVQGEVKDLAAKEAKEEAKAAPKEIAPKATPSTRKSSKPKRSAPKKSKRSGKKKGRR